MRGEFIFVGGYFYDPFFGPYPWWMRAAYPRRYFSVYDYRAELRVLATPREAAVYVDGFYAGIVDDFDGVFQRLLVPPVGHSIALYLDGFRTAHHNLYLRPGSTLKLHDALHRLPPGVASEPPSIASPVPPPSVGSYRAPRTPPAPLPPGAQVPPESTQSVGFGTLDLRVQPAGAEVMIDGQRWVTSDEGHFVVQVSDGTPLVEVSKQGYRRFSSKVAVPEGKTVPLNVSLPPEK